MNDNEIQAIVPDWVDVRTITQMEQQLQPDGTRFKFSGPGWYHYKDGTTLLIVPIDRDLSGIGRVRCVVPDEKFRVYCYANRNPADVMYRVGLLPTRREEE